MTTVTVLYFAALKDVTQTPEESLGMPGADPTVAGFLEFLLDRRPELKQKMVGVRVAVDERFVGLGHKLRPGSVVALLPPVSGG